MICKNCGTEMVEGKKVFICEDCGHRIEKIKTNLTFGECVYKGDMKFQDLDSINQMRELISQKYPFFIKHLIEGMFNGKSALEQNNYCNKAFFWITRYFAFISLCCYLNDDDITKDDGVEDSLSGLSLAYDSSWNAIISAVVSCYKKKDVLFPIPSFMTIMEKLLSVDNGYKDAVRGKHLNDICTKDLSILNAAKELRNLLAHASDAVITEEIARYVLPYYRDIVLSILNVSYDFLNGERFLLVDRVDGNEFRKLQADGGIIHIDIPDEKIEHIFKDTSVALFDLETNSFYPVFPFLYRILETEDEEEMYYDSKTSKNVVYVGWKNSKIYKDAKGYDKLLSLISKKNLSFKKVSIDKINNKYVMDYAIEKTVSTLNRGYINKKYYPECYVNIEWLEGIFEKFMFGGETAFFVTGEAGFGKSAFLADIAMRFLKKEDSGTIPLFLNASEIRKLGFTENPIAWLLREYLLLEKSGAGSLTDIAREFHKIFQKAGLEKNIKLLLIIDAVNEYYSPLELFDEIDGFISSVYSSAGKPLYPWLKVVFSIRQTGYDQIIYHKKSKVETVEKDFSIFLNEQAYYRIIDKNIQSQEEIKMTPVISLKPLDAVTVTEVFRKHISNGKLVNRNFDISIIKGKEKTLKNPLNLLIFIELILQGKAEDLGFSFNEDTLLKEYFCTFSDDIKEFLLKITDIMLEKEMKPKVHYDDAKALCKAFVDEAELNNQVYYKDPLEKLLSLGILKYERQEAETDLALNISFVSQKYCEESIRRNIATKYTEKDMDFAARLLKSEADFEEYNNVVSEFLYELYDNKRIEDMLVPDVANQNRYKRVFYKAFVKELECCSINRLDFQSQEKIAHRYAERLELLMKSKDRLTYVKGLENIFLESILLKYRNRYCTGIILKTMAAAFLKMFLILELKNKYYSQLLNYIGDTELNHNMKETRRLYQESLKISEELTRSTPGDAQLKRNVSVSYNKIGNLERVANNVGEARRLYKKSLEISEKLSRNNPEDVQLKRDVSVSYNKIGNLEKAVNNVGEARRLYKKSLEISEELSGNNPEDTQLKRDVSVLYKQIGDLERTVNNVGEARVLYQKSLEISEELSRNNPEDTQLMRDLSISYSRIGDLERTVNNVREARRLYQKSLEISEELSGKNPEDEKLKRDISIYINQIGDLERAANNVGEARRLYQKSLEISEELNGKNPEDEKLKRDVSISYNKIGDLEKAANNVGEARRLYQKSMEIREELSGKNPEDAQLKRDVSISYNNIGDLERAANNVGEARRLYQKSLEIVEKLSGKNQSDVQLRRDASIYINRIGDLERAANNMGEAKRLYQKSFEIVEELSSKNPEDAQLKRDISIYINQIGDLERAANNVGEARRLYQKSLEISEELSCKNPEDAQLKRDVSVSYNSIGDLERAANNVGEARRLYHKSLEIAEELRGKSPEDAQLKRDVSVLFNNIGDIERAENNMGEARRLYRKSLEISEELSDKNPEDAQLERDVSVSYNKIGDLERAANNVTESRRLYQKSLEIVEELSKKNLEDAQLKREVSIYNNKIGDLEREANNLAEARRLYKKSLKISEELSGKNPENAQLKRYLSVSYNSLGDLERAANNVSEARRLYNKSLKIVEELSRINPEDSQLKRDVSVSYIKIGDLERAESNVAEARRVYQKSLEIVEELSRENPEDAKLKRAISAFYDILNNLDKK